MMMVFTGDILRFEETVKRTSKKGSKSLSPSTKVNKYFVTLSRVNTNIGGVGLLTYDLVAFRLRGLIPSCTLFIITERHKNDVDIHFHIIILPTFAEALSKNSYVDQIGALFPEFKGPQVNVQGIKDIRALVAYMLKDIHISEVVEFIASKGKRDKTPNIWTNKFKTLKNQLKKDPAWATGVKIESILHFRSFDQWKLASLHNRDWAVKKRIPSSQAWSISRNLMPCVKVMEPYMNLLEIEPSGVWDNPDVYLDLMLKYQLDSDHIVMLVSALYALLIRDGYYPLLVKIKGTIIQGRPNTGKTRIFTALIKFFKCPVFFFVGARVNDFTGYHPSDKPIIVFDDVFGTGKQATSKGLKSMQSWSKSTLLRLLAHEPLKIDVKYKTPVEVYPTQCFVITNDKFLFQLHEVESNLKARIKLVCLPDSSRALWAEISEEDLKYLIIFVLTDLKAELEFESLKAFVDYGFNYVVKRLTPWEHVKRPNSTELYEALPYHEGINLENTDQKGSDIHKSDFHFPKNPQKTLELEENYYSDPYKVQTALRQFEDALYRLREEEKEKAVAKLKQDFAKDSDK